MTKSQKGRIAIRTFKTTADALALRGYYKPSGRSGQTLKESLKMLSPEIYGTMNDSRIIELKGLEYVIDRLPRGIEECTRIILTAEDDFKNTAFEKIVPLKRRRVSYKVSDSEMNFVITRGMSEIYDIITHLTFLNIESQKIKNQIHDSEGRVSAEWAILEECVKKENLQGAEFDRALWNLSIILGRTFHETRDSYFYLEKSKKESGSNGGLFKIIHDLGCQALEEEKTRDSMMIVYFTPSLRDTIGLHKYGKVWSDKIKITLIELGISTRPVHIISANMHSVLNGLYAFAALKGEFKSDVDFYEFISCARDNREKIRRFALDHGLTEIIDASGYYIDCQIIDTAALREVPIHPEIKMNRKGEQGNEPVIIVMDYAFGVQAFELMEELLSPTLPGDREFFFDFRSISVMGKAGILPGHKGDIMLATAHVFEGDPHNYIVNNDLSESDFDGSIPVYTGPIVTVLGTSLQNRDVLEKFQTTSWKAVGLEMEGGHFHRAVNSAVIRGHIKSDIRVRYAYYASDNPLLSGQSLSSGPLGDDGIKPTYMITKAIIEKIFV